MRVLIAVDGSEKSIKAVEYAIRIAKECKTLIEVHLLNVQLPVTFGDIKKYVSQEALDSYYRDEGNKALRRSRYLLDEAGLAHKDHIAVNQIAEAIHAYAEAKQCDQIIMGTRGLGALTSLLLGSVASKVLHLINIPVTLVK